MAKKDNSPATKKDVQIVAQDIDHLAQSTKKGFDQMTKFIKQEAEKTRRHFDAEGARTRRHFDIEAAKSRRHFDVVAENIHQDVAGANKDDRVQVLEKHTGLPVGSHHSTQ